MVVKYYAWRFNLKSFIRHPLSQDSVSIVHCFLKTGRCNNFGDELTGYILKVYCRNRDIRVSLTNIPKANFIGVGSILETVIASAGGIISVWGSGLRKDSMEEIETQSVKKLRFLLVRGHLTRKSLPNSSDIPVGDPGLLLSRIFPEKRQVASGILVVPHFSNFGFKSFRKELRKNKSSTFNLLYPTAGIDKIVGEIQASKLVISSALHVLIAADALQVPAIRLIDHSRNIEGDFKFDDYLSSVSDKSGWSQIRLQDIETNELLKLTHVAEERLTLLTAEIQACTLRIEGTLLNFLGNTSG